ncbi:MAG TPA: peptidase M14, partial [Saprospiraceae bacterium]|nr:peptidase M14 [Saprospiraceae bacterium]
MKPIQVLLVIGLMFAVNTIFAQADSSDQLFKKYDNYREKRITHRRFKHHDIEPILLNMKKLPNVEVEEIGRSVENRAIYMVKMGSGKIPVLLWSQMHGDEPTATQALFDIFNFFQKDDELNPLRDKILSELTLYFIPMLNPDGAERFTRRNALQIDINRDARRLESPESKILKAMRERTQAKFGFNLHDQQKYYTAGHHPYPASITFLAPAYNPAEDMNPVRANAAKLIVQLNNMLQKYIPHSVGKWNDDFEPRAFGELMTKWGTSTVLIESGGYSDDPERQFVRKLNFVI